MIPTYGRTMTPAERDRRRRLRAKLARLESGEPAYVPPVPYASVKQRRQAKERRRQDRRPFVGCDGEGWGHDEQGRQYYMLFRMGERELFTGAPLTTLETLKFITEAPASSPHGPIYVAFGFGYDMNMILRDITKERMKRALAPRDIDAKVSRYTWIGAFGVDYLPNNYFRVCRGEFNAFGIMEVVPDSVRTISDVRTFWRGPFDSVLAGYGMADPIIRRGKRKRGQTPKGAKQLAAVRAYCARECQQLAAVMERFRADCIDADVRPKRWEGPGKIAATLLHRHGMPTARDLVAHRPAGCAVPLDVLTMAKDAMSGGRSELMRIGRIGPCYEYDQRSAYAAAMVRLPCLHHGTWREATPDSLMQAPPGSLYIADVWFRHDEARPLYGGLYGLPVRSRRFGLHYPREGNGTYWSCEIESAASLGAKVVFRGGWHFVRECDCVPFGWIRQYYEARQAMDPQAGYPIKLGAGSALYGKFAQRIGAPRWGNFLWAGLTTALVRASMADAAALRPGSVVMIATDGIWSIERLDLPIGEGLGEYRERRHKALFTVTSGLYWTETARKSRGIGTRFFADKTPVFESAWDEYTGKKRQGFDVRPPRVTFQIPAFLGARLALEQERPWGIWSDVERTYSFSWAYRRGQARFDDGYVITTPLPGGRDMTSEPFAAHPEEIAARDQALLELEDQPDVIDFRPPGVD